MALLITLAFILPGIAATVAAYAQRRNVPRATVTCPVDGCGARIDMTGAAPTERSRLTALATDHSRHGGAL
ncbi:hypothetical protein ACH4TP_38145 [Streptomyces sp. NPDC021012]|uniref:hypothetical protein n=1 Tax=Streptomyces sp. NPDC021012 TaxID=3365107 RepID=UPI00378A1848